MALIKNIEYEWGRPLSSTEKYQLNNLDPIFLSRVNFHKVLLNTIRGLKKPIVASKFINFRDKRNQADYDLRLNIVCSDASTIVSNVDGFIGIVKSI